MLAKPIPVFYPSIAGKEPQATGWLIDFSGGDESADYAIVVDDTTGRIRIVQADNCVASSDWLKAVRAGQF